MKNLKLFIATVLIQTIIFIIATELTHLCSTEKIDFYWVCGVVAGMLTEKVFRLKDDD